MTFEHGRKAVFKLESVGGVLTDLSPYIDDVQVDFSADAAENTGLNRLSKDYAIGEMDGTISLVGSFHPTANTLLGGLRGLQSARSWEYGPQGARSRGRCRSPGSASSSITTSRPRSTTRAAGRRRCR